MSRYSVDISLFIAGPFLVGATGIDTYGLDRSFHRDYRGGLAIPASHLKGVLRAAMREVGAAEEPDLNAWFGQASAEHDYGPRTGELEFADLAIEKRGERPSIRNRTAIDYQTGTAADRLLRSLEDAFESGSEEEWTSSICYHAPSMQEADRIAKALWAGLRWISALGGQKTVGYGRLVRVAMTRPTLVETPHDPERPFAGDRLHLVICPQESILIGGVKHPRSSFWSSEVEIPGGVVKGALANALNRAHGIRPSTRPLSPANAQEMPNYRGLVEHYASIRVTHAFPGPVSAPRAVRLPLSAVRVDDDLWDTALSTSSGPLIAGRAPAYFVDWKSPESYLGGSSPATVTMTRTSVNALTGRAADNQLFAYESIAPTDGQDAAIEWTCEVDLSAVPVDVRRQVGQQFCRAVAQHLRRLGKRNSLVKVDVRPGLAATASSGGALIRDGLAIVTLQSDALMLDPEDVRALRPQDDLHNLYAAFWKEASAAEGRPCLALDDFWAHQCFKGGYLYHRYLGAAERGSRPNAYRPYYLTGAGSVFRLRVEDEGAAETVLTNWLERGLALPAWAQAEYRRQGYDLWQTCPFVPENGYGEIAVNLDWHWERRPPTPANDTDF